MVAVSDFRPRLAILTLIVLALTVSWAVRSKSVIAHWLVCEDLNHEVHKTKLAKAKQNKRQWETSKKKSMLLIVRNKGGYYTLPRMHCEQSILSNRLPPCKAPVKQRRQRTSEKHEWKWKPSESHEAHKLKLIAIESCEKPNYLKRDRIIIRRRMPWRSDKINGETLRENLLIYFTSERFPNKSGTRLIDE